MPARPILSEFYGDNTRWFVATVVDASPPYGYEGRVKIRVHGLHTEDTRLIPQNDLPWAQCMIPTTEGGVSGIGRIPQLLPSALVFGFFADGLNSQIPIVMGSLPHIEFPSTTQDQQVLEDIGEDPKPNDIFSRVARVFMPKDVDFQDDNTGNFSVRVKESRHKATVRFFLNIGYTLKQSLAIAGSLSVTSGMRTGVNVQAQGIANWSNDRFSKLKEFNQEYTKFSTQLAFIAYELRGHCNAANIRLLKTDKLEGKGGAVDIFTKYYLENTKIFKQAELQALRIQDRIQ